MGMMGDFTNHLRHKTKTKPSDDLVLICQRTDLQRSALIFFIAIDTVGLTSDLFGIAFAL